MNASGRYESNKVGTYLFYLAKKKKKEQDSGKLELAKVFQFATFDLLYGSESYDKLFD